VHRRRGALTVLATVLLTLLVTGLAGPSTAGGPTSVLLVAPSEGRTASLYNGSPEYQELAGYVGAFDTSNGAAEPPAGVSENGPAGAEDSSGPGVTITWLIHDVSIWRVDRVFLDAKGGPWIATQSSMDGAEVFSKPASWHLAKNGKALAGLLDRLGVGTVGPAGTSGRGTGAQPLAQAPTAAAESNAIAPATSNGRPWPDGWIYGLVGLVLGSALTLAAVRWFPWVRRTAPGAGDDTIAAPGTTEADLDPEPGGPGIETLSSHEPDRR
jgi:hypothetical protein